jgi:hypothetical protein
MSARVVDILPCGAHAFTNICSNPLTSDISSAGTTSSDGAQTECAGPAPTRCLFPGRLAADTRLLVLLHRREAGKQDHNALLVLGEWMIIAVLSKCPLLLFERQ